MSDILLSFIDWRIRKWTICNNFLSVINKYIHTYLQKYFKTVKDLLLNLLCTYTICLFTAFDQINVNNSQQIICVKIQCSVMVAPFHSSHKKIKWIEAFQSRLMSTSVGFSSLIGIIYSTIYIIYLSRWRLIR